MNPTVSPTQQPVLSVDHLTIRFDGVDGVDGPPAVDDLSFTVSHGQVLAVVGESGSGKTLTARSVLGLLPATAHATGDIRLALPDRDRPGATRLTGNLLAAEVDWRSVRGRGAAMVFQEPQTALNPVRTIGWQLTEALRAHHKISRAAVRERSTELLIMVELSDTERILRSYPHQLSGGQKQRIVIALALAGEPALLIADEPTTALDVTVQQEILTLLASLRDRTGTAILLITHNMGVVADLADHVLVMHRGAAVEQGEVISLFARPQADYTRSLLDAVPHSPESPESPAELGQSDAVLRFEEVSLTYPGLLGRPPFPALADVGFDLAPGTVLGVVGESGSGKSTLARTATGTLQPTSGQVLLSGVDLGRADRRELRRLRRRIGFVQQDPATTLNPLLTVAECIAEPFQVHRVNRPGQRAQVAELLDQVHLSAALGHRLPSELSGGQRQRVALARALALRPAVLIADEPTSALDVLVQADVLALFSELQQEQGFACIFISHDLAVVESVSDRILVMRGGAVVESGPTRRVLSAPATDYTRTLLDAAPIADPAAQRTRRAVG